MFSSLFGSSKPDKKRAPKAGKVNINKSIQNIKSAQDTLDKRGAHLEKQIAKLLKSAKTKMKNKNKKGAMYDLKRKKLLEKELTGIENKKLTLETQTLALENAQMNESVFSAIQQGGSALQSVQQQVNVDEVEELMGDMQEMQEDQDAINEALGQSVVDFDDDELLNELEDLDEEVQEQVEDISEDEQYLPDLPDAPVKEISRKKKKNTKEEDELAELESLMS